MVRHEDRSPGKGATEKRELDLGSHTLRVQREGSARDAILCLHGFLESSRSFGKLASHLAPRWQVACLDQRGHGSSTAPQNPPAWQDLVRDVAAVLEGLGLERVTLVGHSLGGLVALHCALEWLERIDRLVLIATPDEVPASQRGWLRDVIEAGERAGSSGLSRVLYGSAARREIEGDAAGLVGIARLMADSGAGEIAPELVRIRRPTLVIVGAEDPMGVPAAERVASDIPDGRLVVMEGQGHWPHVHAAESTARHIAAFLSEPRL